jgi:hypothetical protein
MTVFPKLSWRGPLTQRTAVGRAGAADGRQLPVGSGQHRLADTQVSERIDRSPQVQQAACQLPVRQRFGVRVPGGAPHQPAQARYLGGPSSLLGLPWAALGGSGERAQAVGSSTTAQQRERRGGPERACVQFTLALPGMRTELSGRRFGRFRDQCACRLLYRLTSRPARPFARLAKSWRAPESPRQPGRARPRPRSNQDRHHPRRRTGPVDQHRDQGVVLGKETA